MSEDEKTKPPRRWRGREDDEGKKEGRDAHLADVDLRSQGQ